MPGMYLIRKHCIEMSGVDCNCRQITYRVMCGMSLNCKHSALDRLKLFWNRKLALEFIALRPIWRKHVFNKFVNSPNKLQILCCRSYVSFPPGPFNGSIFNGSIFSGSIFNGLIQLRSEYWTEKFVLAQTFCNSLLIKMSNRLILL